MSAVLQSPAPTPSVATTSKPAQAGNTPPPGRMKSIIPAAPREWRINWDLVWARCKQIAWTVVTKIPLALVYFVFISEGIRRLAPEMATKLHKLPIPFLVHLEDYESTYELDVAHVAAELLLILSFVSWYFLLSWILKEDLKERIRKWNWTMKWVERVLITGAVVIIVGDMGLFYESFSHSIFGRSSFSAKSFIATLVYALILVIVNFVSLYLAQCSREIKEKGKE